VDLVAGLIFLGLLPFVCCVFRSCVLFWVGFFCSFGFAFWCFLGYVYFLPFIVVSWILSGLCYLLALFCVYYLGFSIRSGVVMFFVTIR